MPIARLRAIWRNIYDSLWFLPALFTLGAMVAASVLVRADAWLPEGINRRELAWLFSGGAEGARGVLDAIAGSIITVTGVVFSVTIVALQLASSQYTPRVLRTFMADRANQLVLAVFIGTFVYALLVMRTIHSGGDDYDAFVPAVATTFGVVLAIVSIGFLIYYIHHAARSLQVETIMANVTRDALRTIRREYQELEKGGPAAAARQGTDAANDATPQPTGTAVHARWSGYITALDRDRLLEVSRRAGCVVHVQSAVGDYVYPGSVLARLEKDDVDDELIDHTRDAFAAGAARTHHQDVRLSVIELVDIAAKALSPGINDPTTAMSAIDRLGEIILELGHRHAPQIVHGDDGGTLIPRVPGWDDLIHLAFAQIGHYGAGHVPVGQRIAHTIGHVGPMLPPGHRASLRALLAELRTVSLEPLTLAPDRAAIERSFDRADAALA